MRRYLSTYKVLNRGELTVTLPFILFMLVMMSLGVFVALKTDSIFYVVSLMALSFILPIFLYQHQKIKWKLWAFENVRDLSDLLTKETSSLLLSGNNPLEEKTILSYKKDKERIKEIAFERKQNKTFALEIEDTFLPAKTEIKYSIIYYLFFLLIGISIGYVFFLIPTNTGDAIFGKVVFGISALLFIQWSIRRLIDRDFILKLSHQGIELRKYGVLSWDKIENLQVFSRIHHRGSKRSTREKSLEFSFKHGGELKTLKFNIRTLDISMPDLDETIKIYQLRHKKRIKVSNTV